MALGAANEKVYVYGTHVVGKSGSSPTVYQFINDNASNYLQSYGSEFQFGDGLFLEVNLASPSLLKMSSTKLFALL